MANLLQDANALATLEIRMSRAKVLIVGGGFGGVKAALELADSNQHDVTLLSDQVTLRYYPSLYRTATGGKQANSIISLHKLFENKGVAVVHGSAVTLDRVAKTITTNDGQVLGFDSLVLALGVVTNYFGIEGLEQYSFGIKSIEEAERLKAHLHQQLTDDRQPDLNYVIVGAGPTGIELAGALMAYVKHLMKKHGIRNRSIHVDLIEAKTRLLPNMPRDTSRMVGRRLKRLGVKLYVGQAVQAETADSLVINGRPIRSHTVIWTAGVTNHPFFKANGFTLMHNGKVAVDIFLQAEPDIYIIGDNANTPYSGMAQTAIHDGEFIAENLKRKAFNKEPESYWAKRPVIAIPVGEHWAAVLWGRVRLYGWLGWILRELSDLVGFHDYETWPKATEQWLTEFGGEESCPVCASAPQIK